MSAKNLDNHNRWRNKTVAFHMGLARKAKHAGNGRASDVGVKNGAVLALPGQGHGQQRGYQRFAHPALAAHNTYYLADAALRMRFYPEILLRFAAIAATFATASTLMVAITHFTHLPRVFCVRSRRISRPALLTYDRNTHNTINDICQ